MTRMHVNDSLFWVVTGLSRMSVAEGYRGLTLINVAMGVTAFAAVLALGSILGIT